MAGLIRRKVSKALKDAGYICNSAVRGLVTVQVDSRTENAGMVLLHEAQRVCLANGLEFRFIKAGQKNGNTFLTFSSPEMKAQEAQGGHAGAVSNFMFQEEQEVYDQGLTEADVMPYVAEQLVEAEPAPAPARRGRNRRGSQPATHS